MPAEQKAKEGPEGAWMHCELKNLKFPKSSVTIDWALAKETMMDGRSMLVVWVDFAKAYDKVPHPWVLEVLGLVRASLSP